MKVPVVDPLPHQVDRVRVLEDVIFEVTKAMLGDPEPQPSLVAVFGGKAVRLAGAKALARRMSVAQDLRSKEIERHGR